MSNRNPILNEARSMAAIALPAVADQIGMMSMGLVDTIMVGRLGRDEIGAVGVASSIYFFYMVFCFGSIAAVGPTVAQAFGARNKLEIERGVGQSFWIALVLAAGGMVITSNVAPILRLLDEPASVITFAEQFADALRYGIPASLLYAALRSFTSGLGRTRITMVISVVASLLNAGLDYVLIYGKLGFPAYGVQGAGMSTAIVQWAMLAMAAVLALRLPELRQYRITQRILPLHRPTLVRLIRLGAPIGIGQAFEVGIFALATLFMGQFGKAALAAHQIALTIASFTFMIPLGISVAITTRVGQFIGERNPERARLAGWTGIGLSVVVMAAAAVVMIVVPRAAVAPFTLDTEVIDRACGLLLIAAAFQIFDGVQVATLGALRGLKDTARPMLVNLLAYWLVGVPIGYVLAFPLGLEGAGLWWGLTTGLATAALLHTARFRRLVSAAPRATTEPGISEAGIG